MHDPDIGTVMFCHGWRRLYPQHIDRGRVARAVGMIRLSRALDCVDEDGTRLRPWPEMRNVQPTTAYSAIRAGAQGRRLRALFGIG